MSAPVDALYDALRAGDEPAVLAALHPEFRGRYAEGMPVASGLAKGPQEGRDHWWAIGAAYRMEFDVDEVIDARDGRFVALGTYRGSRRADGHEVEARFAHVWTVRDDLVAGLEQITDTARW